MIFAPAGEGGAPPGFALASQAALALQDDALVFPDEFRARCPSGIDLILSPRPEDKASDGQAQPWEGDGVLLDFATGATLRAGDLLASLKGSGASDRDRELAQKSEAFSDGETLPDPAIQATPLDRLFTTGSANSAELSTMLLRLRPKGRCAASWITSETVSGASLGRWLARSVRLQHQPSSGG